MKPNIKKIYIYGAVITSILGVINHFLYEWTGNNSFIALFCATNESTWEHLKLLFFPYLIWVIVSYFCIGKENEGYINTNALSCITMNTITPALKNTPEELYVLI